MLPPIQLYVEITTACNLRCPHCYIRGGEEVHHLSSVRLHELIAEFHEIGGQYVSISGGDPILHPDWRPAVRFTRSLGLACLLLTNGTNLRADDIDFTIATGTSLSVSVEAGSAASHDAIRGHGAFAKAMRALDYAVASGHGAETTLAFTPMSANAKELPRVVALAKALGVGSVYISLLERRGRAVADFETLRLNKSAKTGLLFSVLSLQERYPEVAIQCVNLKGFTERLRGIDLETESLDRTIRVTAQGQLVLTAYLDAEPFQLGRYRRGNLAELWNSPKVRRAFADASVPASCCARCELWPLCRGGSSAFAWIRNGGPGGVDGYCAAKQRLAAAMRRG
jgi:radical SAM protein with 4Fe4S-binding SPASM domain